MRMPSRPVAAALGGTVLLAALLFAFGGRGKEERYVTAVVDRGDVVEVVGATGTLQAVTTVQVGSQVSGTIQSLYADFNSTVRKGQVIARLDPSLFQARVGQARANLIAARANVERSRATVEDTRQKYERARELASQRLLPQSELETAKANHDGAAAQLKASEAAVSQASANLNQADVDLAHTVIAAPIDGVVIARNVDVGQTVAASFQAPVLFVIANDLSQMRVNASIDEADIGRVRQGQEATFRVDSYPDQTFPGRVEQVRLQPTTVQNVVTYNAIIAVENPGLRLMPGMTATVSLEVRRSDNALRIPSSALRFRPEGFEMTDRRRADGPGQPPGPPGDGRAAGGPAQGGDGAARRPGAGGRGFAFRRGEGGPGRSLRENNGPPAGGGRPALLFVMNEQGQPEPMRVHLGISDGQFVEVRDGLAEGARVVTGLEAEGGRGASPRPGASPGSNPFTPQLPQQRRR